MQRLSMFQRHKNKLKDNPDNDYWQLEDQMVLSLDIEKNGGKYLVVKGTNIALEYIAGILSDNNIPHYNQEKSIEVFVLSLSELKDTIEEANLPFKTLFSG